MLANHAFERPRAICGPRLAAALAWVDKQAAGAPAEIFKRYEKWKDIASISGPMGLRLIKGFRDEALTGEWKGYRSSRLGDQWRIIYCVVADETLFRVESITAHDYRRP